MAIDPVCGMEVDKEKAAGKSEYNDETYYFCSPGCKAAFDKDPEKYIGKSDAGSALSLIHISEPTRPY